MSQAMVKRIVSWGAIAALLIGALGLGYLAYRRIGAPPQLLRNAVVVDGVITEKLIEDQRLNPLPITVPAYVVRYSFPTTFGQMRTGQQTVTRATFERLGDQGAAAQVVMSPDDTGVNAIDARITFPAGAGVRLGAAIGCLALAYLVLVFGVMKKG